MKKKRKSKRRAPKKARKMKERFFQIGPGDYYPIGDGNLS